MRKSASAESSARKGRQWESQRGKKKVQAGLLLAGEAKGEGLRQLRMSLYECAWNPMRDPIAPSMLPDAPVKASAMASGNNPMAWRGLERWRCKA